MFVLTEGVIMTDKDFDDAIQILRFHNKLYYGDKGFISATNGGIHLKFEEFVRLFDEYEIKIHTSDEEYINWILTSHYNDIIVFCLADNDKMTSIKKTRIWLTNNKPTQ
jgi:hypothetical protein